MFTSLRLSRLSIFPLLRKCWLSYLLSPSPLGRLCGNRLRGESCGPGWKLIHLRALIFGNFLLGKQGSPSLRGREG